MSEKKIPLIFALRHLHIQSPEGPQSLEAFLSTIRLMQDEREVPQAGDLEVDRFLESDHSADPPPDFMLQMIRTDCPDWPDAVIHAMQGLAEYGPGNIESAAASAHRSLVLDRRCKLGRQLIKLLSSKHELRIPFRSESAPPPDVPALLAE